MLEVPHLLQCGANTWLSSSCVICVHMPHVSLHLCCTIRLPRSECVGKCIII